MATRRSGRARQASTKYSIDPFEGLENALYASSDSGSSSSSDPAEDSQSDPEVQPIDIEEEDDDVISVSEGAPENDSDEERNGEVRGVLRQARDGFVVPDHSDDEYEDEEIVEAANVKKRTITKTTGMTSTMHMQQRYLRGRARTKMPADQMRQRGIADYAMKGSKETRAIYIFGPSVEDITPILKTRDKWIGQLTFPSRNVNKQGDGGLAPSFYCSAESVKKEVDHTRKWYWEQGGREAFQRGQKSTELAEEEGRPYLLDPQLDTHFLLGPFKAPKLYNLQAGKFMCAEEAFESRTYKTKRRAWIFNLGGRPQDAQWAVGTESKTQYLAVVAQVTNALSGTPKPLQNPRAPAFAAQKPSPACIQIWAFHSFPSGDLDAQTPPRLELVICTNWGSIKQIRWSHVAPSENAQSREDETFVHLGLLAVIFSDGKTRVLDLSYPKTDPINTKTRYLNITKAAFEVSPPGTVCSSLTWLSGTSLAVATASGMVAIWTLTHTNVFPSSSNDDNTANPRPWFYQQLHSTYIVNISSAYPSRPYIISTISADGYNRLTDIRSPHMDTVSRPRTRIFGLAQVWHEHTQCFAASDETFNLNNHPIRRYYMNLRTTRGESPILSCASSPVHPGILIGCADGAVVGTNPLSRIMDGKEIPWQQIWFKHEWRKGQKAEEHTDRDNRKEEAEPIAEKDDTVPTDTNETTPTPSSNTAVPSGTLNRPLSRILEGFKPAATLLGDSRKDPNLNSDRAATIYERPTGITCVAWNPNLRAGTWAVAGMGSGLLRVEDLGV